MKREGFEYMEMARYAWLGDQAGLTSGVEEVRRLLPIQKSTTREGVRFQDQGSTGGPPNILRDHGHFQSVLQQPERNKIYLEL